METNILKMITIADIASICNAVSGLLAIIAVLNGYTILSAHLLLLAVVFDSIDGTLARKFNNDQSHAIFGETIDSLADMISFGVAPSIVLYMTTSNFYIIIPMIFLVVCGLLRLTRYNALLSQQEGLVKSFIGLPIPTSSMLIATLILSSYTNFIFMFIVTILISLLMVSSVEYPKVRDQKIIGIIGILTVLCIIPNVNNLLFKIPSYILVALTFIYIFGVVVYSYVLSSKDNDVLSDTAGSVNDVFNNIKSKKPSKSKKDLYKK